MKTLLAVRAIMVLGLIVLPVSAALGAVPQAPTDLTGTVQSPTAIKLDWVDKSLDETSFRIERSLDGPTASDELGLQMSGLNAGATYYWKVVADDGKGGTRRALCGVLLHNRKS